MTSYQSRVSGQLTRSRQGLCAKTRDVDARLAQAVARRGDNGRCSGRIPMKANALRHQRYATAVACNYTAATHDGLHLRGGLDRVGQQRPSLGATLQGSIWHIAPISKCFANKKQPSIGGRLGERHRTGQAQQRYVATEPRNTAGNRLGEDRVDSGLVVQRPMWLYVRELNAMRAAESVQSTRLVQNHGFYFVRRETHFSAAEALQIRIARLRAHTDVISLAQRDCVIHDLEITGVETARHVGAGDVAHHLAIVAETPAAVAFTEIAVEVNRVRHRSSGEV
jgi:hypothetical protein